VSAATFSENVLSFAVAYGTALAAMMRGRIHTNLLPVEIVRGRLWKQKRLWFAAAAAVLVAALAGPLFRASADRKVLADSPAFRQANTIVADAEKLRKGYEEFKNKGLEETKQIHSYLKLFAYRDFVPSVQTLISRSIREVAPDQPRLVAYAKDLELSARAKVQLAAAEKKEDARAIEDLTKEIKDIDLRIERFKSIPRNKRRFIIIEKMVMSYVRGEEGGSGRRTTPRPTAGQGAGEEAQRKFSVVMSVRTPLPQNVANDMFGALRRKCEENARAEDMKSVRFHELKFVYRSGAARGAAVTATPVRPPRPGTSRTPAVAAPAVGEARSDPLFDESTAEDTCLDVTVTVSVADEGLGVDLDEKVVKIP
jgi:hypothetical protein